ncbi:arabinogalactan protein 19 [Actinidia rufa]|uniref:Arabinogalactan protein 19 n=1 Tax=Actinidia rufa TaxID=165716 RepID=A0A7J0GZA8_9ERIC|nr:arabinogalactan protein 19 [Actinidia rufa]
MYYGQIVEDVKRHEGVAGAHGIVIQEERNAVGSYALSSGVECEWRKKSEKKLTEVSVKRTESLKKSSNDKSETRDTGYRKPLEIHESDEAFCSSEKRASGREETLRAEGSLVQETRHEHTKTAGHISQKDEHKRNSRQISEVSKIQKINDRVTSTSRRQSEARVKKHEDISTVALSLVQDKEEHHHITDKQPAPVHPFHPNILTRQGVLSAECADAMQQFFQLRRRKEKKPGSPPTPPSCLPISNHPNKYFYQDARRLPLHVLFVTGFDSASPSNLPTVTPPPSATPAAPSNLPTTPLPSSPPTAATPPPTNLASTPPTTTPTSSPSPKVTPSSSPIIPPTKIPPQTPPTSSPSQPPVLPPPPVASPPPLPPPPVASPPPLPPPQISPAPAPSKQAPAPAPVLPPPMAPPVPAPSPPIQAPTPASILVPSPAPAPRKHHKKKKHKHKRHHHALAPAPTVPSPPSPPTVPDTAETPSPSPAQNLNGGIALQQQGELFEMWLKIGVAVAVLVAVTG